MNLLLSSRKNIKKDARKLAKMQEKVNSATFLASNTLANKELKKFHKKERKVYLKKLKRLI